VTGRIRRRSFVGGATALASLSFPAAGRDALAAGDQYDLIVVGAGTAGLPAAIFAARRGARVALIDAAPAVGGTLFLSTGMVAAAGTRLQAKLGISDSPQAHFDDVMRISHQTADPELVRLTVDHAGSMFDWLMDSGFEPLPGQPVFGDAHEPYLTRRYVWGAEGGRSILAVLRRELEPQLASGRIDLKLDSPVTALLTSDGGAVEGVRVKSGDVEQVYRGRRVLLTAGGYAGNATLFEALNGVRHYTRLSYAFAQGAGIELGVSVGGYVRGRQNYLSNFGSILEDENYPTTMLARWVVIPQKRPPWELYVNGRGERFVREDEPSTDAREHALLRQPDLRYWIVFDEAILAAAPVGIPNWTRAELRAKFNQHPMFAQASSLPELARRVGFDADTFSRSVANYNAGVAAGRDGLGREHLPLPIVQPPFYAVRHQGHSITSTVGLAVDRQLRVLRAGGEPIPNLYAAGEILGSGQTMGSAFVGGMMVTPALTFGQLLGSTLPI
jgi:fumarate reductase flavoprotein subunit